MPTQAQKAAQRALALAEAGALPAAWRALAPHRDAALAEFEVAATWVALTAASDSGWRWRALLGQILARFPDEPELLELACEALMGAIAGRPHDVTAHDDTDDPALITLIAAERGLALLGAAAPVGLRYWRGAALRLCGPARALDAVAALQDAVRAHPDAADWRYDLALAQKAAGQFDDALASLDLFGQASPDAFQEEGWLWNHAICATGAGRGPLALARWHDLGMTDADIGFDGLPRVPDLADLWLRLRLPDGQHARALARPQSPCHGTLLQDVGALPSGTRLLWDGAPVEPVEADDVPCLPVLAPLPSPPQSGRRR